MNIWVTYLSKESVSLFLLQWGNYPPFLGRWLMIAYGSQKHMSFYFIFFFSPSYLWTDRLFLSVFWRETLKSSRNLTGLFSERPVDLQINFLFGILEQLFVVNDAEVSEAYKSAFALHFSFSQSISSEGKPQPRQTERRVHKCVVTGKGWLTHEWGQGHLLWPPDFIYHRDNRDPVPSPKLTPPAVAWGLAATSLVCESWETGLIWCMCIELGVLVASCSLTRPMWHLLSPMRPSAHNPYFHFHFLSLTILLSHLWVPPHSHAWARRAASVVIWVYRVLLLPYSSRVYPLHWLLTHYFPFPCPFLTCRGHRRPQLMVKSEPCCYCRGCIHICLMQNSLTYKRLVLFMNINGLEMGVEKIIFHEEITEMIKFRKHLTRDLHNMCKENNLFKKPMVPSFSKTL